jgi:hypothetical protein
MQTSGFPGPRREPGRSSTSPARPRPRVAKQKAAVLITASTLSLPLFMRHCIACGPGLGQCAANDTLNAGCSHRQDAELGQRAESAAMLLAEGQTGDRPLRVEYLTSCVREGVLEINRALEVALGLDKPAAS